MQYSGTPRVRLSAMVDPYDADGGLVEEAKRDPGAFARLYDLYFPRVYAYISARVGNKESAQDVASDVFLKIVQSLPTFEWRSGDSFSAWVFRIARNTTLNYHRDTRQEWSTRESISSLQDEIDSLPSVAPLPEDELLRREERESLLSLVQKLPQRRQEIITLRFFGELHNREIAAILNLDEHTVASHLCRGLRDLHRLWLEEAVRTNTLASEDRK
jgi:RNA polymerase sigma-70 factor (ECF subfamily)